LTEISDASGRILFRTAIFGNDIYCFSWRSVSSTEVIKLLPDGGAEELYVWDDQYNGCSVGEDGRIYLADLECNLYVINENGEPEFLFDLGRIKRRRPVFDLSVLGDGEYLAMFDCKVYSITKNPEDI